MSKVGSCPDIISYSLVGIFWTSASLYYSFCLCQRIQVGLLSWEVVACERRVVVVDLITAALAFVYMLLWTYSAVIESEQKQPVFFSIGRSTNYFIILNTVLTRDQKSRNGNMVRQLGYFVLQSVCCHN